MPEVITEALVLIIDERICSRCGEEFRAPDGLFIRCRGFRNKIVYKHIDEIPARSFLQCERKILRREVAACEHCFPVHDEGQLALFPDTFGLRFIELGGNIFGEEEEGAKQKIKPKAKAKAKMFQLSDF